MLVAHSAAAAINRFCAAQGAVSGFGAVEYNNDTAIVACVNTAEASISGQFFSTLINFNFGCTAANPASGSCNSAIHGYCVSIGSAAGGFGAVEHDGDNLQLVCIK